LALFVLSIIGNSLFIYCQDRLRLNQLRQDPLRQEPLRAPSHPSA
jgi:hypothetical protein